MSNLKQKVSLNDRPYHPYRREEYGYEERGNQRVCRPARKVNSLPSSILNHDRRFRWGTIHSDLDTTLEVFDRHQMTLAQLFKQPTISTIIRQNIAEKLFHIISTLHAASLVSGKISPSHIFINLYKDSADVCLDSDILNRSNGSGVDITRNYFEEDMYCSPQIRKQLKDKKDLINVTKSDDIFSVGCIIYQLSMSDYTHPFGEGDLDIPRNIDDYLPINHHRHMVSATKHNLVHDNLYEIASSMIRYVPDHRVPCELNIEYYKSNTKNNTDISFNDWISNNNVQYAYSVNEVMPIERLSRGEHHVNVFPGDFNTTPALVKKYSAHNFFSYSNEHEKELVALDNENLLKMLATVKVHDESYYVFYEYEASTLVDILSYNMNGMKHSTVLNENAYHQVVAGFKAYHDIATKYKYSDAVRYHNNICAANIFVGSGGLKLGFPDLQIDTHAIVNNDYAKGIFSREFCYAPELLANETKMQFTEQTSVFALGCVLYMIRKHGKHPFTHVRSQFFSKKDAEDIKNRIKNGDYVTYTKTQPFETFIKEMLSTDPAKRPTLEEVYAAFPPKEIVKIVPLP